jgi:CelD/BcsL family acetyltransferase involved in cellulose biosynthesis
MISTDVEQGIRAIERIQSEWSALVDRSESAASVFSRPEWHLAWLDAHPKTVPTLISAHAEGQLVGVLPLVRIRTDLKGMFATLISPSAGDVTDFNSPIVKPETASTVLPALFDAAFQHFGKYSVYSWRGFPADDPSLSILRSYFRNEGVAWNEVREPAPRLRFEGSGYQDAEKQWSANHRLDVRRRRKRLAQEGPLSLWQPSSLPEANELLEAFFDVHDAKWLSQGVPGKFQDSWRREHYRSILRRLWGRGLHFSTVRCGAVDLSYHFGFVSGGWLLWYKPAYRTDYAQFSPGKVHISLLVEEGYRLGWKGIDFLLGDEKYKFAWSNDSTDVVHFNACRYSWLPSYIWFTSARPLVRSHFVGIYWRSKSWVQRQRLRVAPTSSDRDG